MKRIGLILVVLFLTGSARADVKIIVTDLDGIDPGKVAEISYDATGETELIRAFALDITVDTGVILDINDYAISDDNCGYGIFPGNFAAHITVNPTTGNVDNWGVAGYTPVAPPGDPDALGGLGTPGITIEMGSLYDTMAPGKTGVLCTVTVSEGCHMSVTGNAIRGNVVLENAAEAALDLTEATNIPINFDDEFPSWYSTYPYWVALGKPNCWCGACGYPQWPYQCDGDADNKTEGLLKYRVALGDLNEIIANWKKRINDPHLNPCADIDHKPEGLLKFRVALKDLNIIIANWKKRDSALPGDCGTSTRTP